MSIPEDLAEELRRALEHEPPIVPANLLDLFEIKEPVAIGQGMERHDAKRRIVSVQGHKFVASFGELLQGIAEKREQLASAA